MVEWVNHAVPLKELIKKELEIKTSQKSISGIVVMRNRLEWIKKVVPKANSIAE